MDMARAYAVLANGGFAVEPHIITRMNDINGNVVFEPEYPVACRTCESESEEDLDDFGEPANMEDLFAQDDSEPLLAERVIDERVAFIISSMLSDVIRRGTGTRARKLERSDLAGKTGTTNDAADTWFNGFNADVTTTVWVGFDDYQPLGDNVYGSNTPLPIWIDFMEVALKDRPQKALKLPSGVITMKIDPATGRLAPPGSSDTIFEYFLREHVPTEVAKPMNTQPGVDEVKPEELF
jgi:penicillin-binding protein 1A